MKNKITFLILFIMLGFCSLQAQVTQEWVARYNGAGNSADGASSLTVDGSGNVYVTGSIRVGSGTNNDYTTIKYNSSGDSVWVARYNGPENGYDRASSIAVDGTGNVYVTGESNSGGIVYNFATIKYNSSGEEQWVQRSSVPTNPTWLPSLAIDVSGNVYVAGYSAGNIVTIKYNTSGIQQWVQMYDGPQRSSGPYILFISIVVGESGNVYVSGTEEVNGANYVTIKYSSSGAQGWVQIYNGPANSWDDARSIAVDHSENVYVTGTSMGSGTNQDYATIKYNSSGVQQRVQRYNGGSYDAASSVAVDISGNVFVTGSSSNSSSTDVDYATIKYNSSGDSLWVRRYSGPGNGNGGANSLGVDSSGNVYVTGFSYSGGNDYDYATIRYSSAGVQQWVQIYKNGYANSLAVDNSGNVFVTGSSLGDYATIKYSQLTGITQSSNSIPEKFSLSQNYPNPFNPTTTLEFGISKLGFVSLIVYNTLGKEVATLVNSNLNAGKYNYQLSTDNYRLTSGVYFYNLSVDGNIIDTKRMVLLK